MFVCKSNKAEWKKKICELQRLIKKTTKCLEQNREKGNKTNKNKRKQ